MRASVDLEPDASSNSPPRLIQVDVLTLKGMIEPVCGVPAATQRLIHRGRVLKDDQRVSSARLTDGDTILLVQRPPDSPAATFPTEATAATDAASSEALLAHDLTVVQSCLDAAHGAIARHGGMLRQFVIDDKGAVIIWCFGLPGCAFEDNARRGLRSSSCRSTARNGRATRPPPDSPTRALGRRASN